MDQRESREPWWSAAVNVMTALTFLLCYSPPVRRQRGRRDRQSRHNSISQDENYHHLPYAQQQAIEEPRAFHPPNVSPRLLHPAAHPPQQNAVMVDIHDQVRRRSLQDTQALRVGGG